MGDVAGGERRTCPLGEAVGEGLALLNVAENEGFFVLGDEGFVYEHVFVHELFFLSHYGLLRRWRLRRRRRALPGGVVAHWNWEGEKGGVRVESVWSGSVMSSRHFLLGVVTR